MGSDGKIYLRLDLDRRGKVVAIAQLTPVEFYLVGKEI